MRYINNYNYNTLIIIDSKNNETVGKVLLDIEDIPKVQKYHWRLNEKGYVIASIKGHKTNRNKLDNRKENLRIISHLENNLNTDRIEKGKGYCFRKDRNK
jgi:hypothetical protein